MITGITNGTTHQFLQVFDARTGQSIKSAEMFVGEHPELAVGEDNIKVHRDQARIEFETKDDGEYWFALSSEKIYPSLSALKAAESDSKKARFSLKRNGEKLSEPAYLFNKRLNSDGPIFSESFLLPKIIYQNETLAVVLHRGSLTAGSDILLTGVSSAGKMLWRSAVKDSQVKKWSSSEYEKYLADPFSLLKHGYFFFSGLDAGRHFILQIAPDPESSDVKMVVFDKETGQAVQEIDL